MCLLDRPIEGGGVSGRPPVKWIDRVEEYWRERERVGEVWKALRESA